jgi:hypothetical protein
MVLRRPQGIFGAADNRFLLRIFTAPALCFPDAGVARTSDRMDAQTRGGPGTAAPPRFANQPFTAQAHDTEKRVPVFAKDDAPTIS